MSVKAMSWVFDHSPYTLGGRLVHLVLADVANDLYENRVWLTQTQIAERAAVSDRAVRAAIRQMVADGFLEEVEKPRGKPVVYRLLMPAVTPEVTSGVGDDTPEAASGDPGRKAQPHNYLTQEEPNAPSEAKKGSRERDPAWDALVAAVGWEPSTRAEKARVGKAVREIAKALPDGTSREDVGKHITARAGRYRQHWPTAELTPESLVKHWSKFAPGAQHDTPARPAAAPERGTMTRAEMLRRNGPPEALSYEEFTESLAGLSDAEREQRRQMRRQGLAWKIRTETGELVDDSWHYDEERGWRKRPSA